MFTRPGHVGNSQCHLHHPQVTIPKWVVYDLFTHITPIAGWCINVYFMENPMIVDDLEVPPFSETSI